MIGIITVLMRLLLPAAVSVRRKAVQTKCASNLRQIYGLFSASRLSGKGQDLMLGEHRPAYFSDGGKLACPFAEPMANPNDPHGPPWNTGYVVPPPLRGKLFSDMKGGEAIFVETSVRHSGSTNQVYADGHVQAVRQ